MNVKRLIVTMFGCDNFRGIDEPIKNVGADDVGFVPIGAGVYFKLIQMLDVSSEGFIPVCKFTPRVLDHVKHIASFTSIKLRPSETSDPIRNCITSCKHILKEYGRELTRVRKKHEGHVFTFYTIETVPSIYKLAMRSNFFMDLREETSVHET